MAQIINEYPGFGTAFGQGFGQAFGSGLSEGLANLAQAKMDQIRQREDYKILSSLGVDPQQAKFISRLPSEQKNQLIGKFFDTVGQQQQQPVQQSAAPAPQPEIEAPATRSQQPNLSQMLSGPSSVLSPEILDQVLRSPVRQQQQRQIAAQEQQQIRQQAQPEQTAPQAVAQRPQVVAQPEAKATRVGQRPSLSAVLNPKEAEAQRKAEQEAKKEQFNREKLERSENLEREKIEKRDRAAADKETKPWYDEAMNGEKAATGSDETLRKMKHLTLKGKLPPASLYKYLKDAEESLSSAGGAAKTVGGLAALGFAAGGPVGAAIGAGTGVAVSPLASMALYGVRSAYPDTEEFEKLSNDFVKYAKQYFGSRLTDADLKAFMATVPTLANTEHGKLAIIHNMELFNEAVHAKTRIIEQVMEENGGHRPRDIAIQVERRLAPELDKIAAKWKHSAESAESTLLRSV